MDKKLSDNKIAIFQKKLISMINGIVREDGLHATTIPALELFRTSNVSEPLHTIYKPSLLVIVQGSKIVTLADENYQYDSASYLVASVHLPITGQIIQASHEKPYLCVQINFNTEQILDIVKESDEVWSGKKDSGRGMVVSEINSDLLDAVLRLVKLLYTPKDIPILSPLIIREILYRILQDRQGDLIKQFAMIGSHAHCIEKVIRFINSNYSKSLRIEDLAREVNMSISSLYNQFKKVTAMSPLQYQKLIRLQEARRLLFSESAEAADVGFQVGYESPSQFSREYARMFGLPPIRDIKRLRNSLSSYNIPFTNIR